MQIKGLTSTLEECLSLQVIASANQHNMSLFYFSLSLGLNEKDLGVFNFPRLLRDAITAKTSFFCD